MFGVLISNRIASLQELRTIYDLRDAMDMYEAYIVPRYNEWAEAQDKSKKWQNR